LPIESNADVTFSKIRNIIFPIHDHELKRFIPMAVIMVCILFNYSILRATKDALIATAPGAGVEVIPYLKSIFVMFSAAIFVVVYTKISNIFSFDKIFYSCNLLFIIFFLIFAFILYPNLEFFHPKLFTIQEYQTVFPRFKFLFSVWGVWTYSLFYIMAEMWGNIMIPLLFWQFANQNIALPEAKRFYPMFILFGNIALVFSGYFLKLLCDPNFCPTVSADAWEGSVKGLMILVSLMAVVSIFSFKWLHSTINNISSTIVRKFETQREKPFKLGIFQSFLYIFSNRYIGLIALLIFSYSISINLVELVWKKQIALWFSGDFNGYNTFMGRYVMWTGIATIIIAFLTKGVINRYGWLKGAIATPIVLAVLGAFFFTLLLAGGLLEPLLITMALPATYLAMEVGMFQSILTRGIKYTLFDTSKEMAYIPLDDELKAKGKAVVDIMGARLGKTLGSWLVLVLFYTLAVQDIMDILPYLTCVIGVVLLGWILGVCSLHRLYVKKVNQKILNLPENESCFQDSLHGKTCMQEQEEVVIS